MDKSFRHIIEYVLREEPECADDLVYAIELVKTCFEDTESKIKKSIEEALVNSRYAEIRELSTYCEELDALIADIDGQIVFMTQNMVTEQSKPQENRTQVDYAQYATNRMKPHIITEDFEHKRPCAFRFQGRMVQVDSWQDITVKVCGILAEIDPDKMQSLTQAECMQGRKIRYITEVPVPRRTKRIPGTDLYVWINNSANTLMKMIRRIFREYGIPDDDIEIYLRADYTPLHSGEETSDRD